MEDKSYDDRLRHLGMRTVEERRNIQDLIQLCEIFIGLSQSTS